MGAAACVEHIVVDVEPPDIEVALGGEVQQIGSAVAAHLQHERRVLGPVQVCVAFERFLNEMSKYKKNI